MVYFLHQTDCINTFNRPEQNPKAPTVEFEQMSDTDGRREEMEENQVRRHTEASRFVNFREAALKAKLLLRLRESDDVNFNRVREARFIEIPGLLGSILFSR